jgi:hypothetical protein
MKRFLLSVLLLLLLPSLPISAEDRKHLFICRSPLLTFDFWRGLQGMQEQGVTITPTIAHQQSRKRFVTGCAWGKRRNAFVSKAMNSNLSRVDGLEQWRSRPERIKNLVPQPRCRWLGSSGLLRFLRQFEAAMTAPKGRCVARQKHKKRTEG